LGIDEDEIDDLIFEEGEYAPKEGMKLMALPNVHSMNYFTPDFGTTYERIFGG
jgi:hypothetical protein